MVLARVEEGKRSFALVVSKAKQAEWVLQCQRFRAPPGEEPVLVELPASSEANIGEHLATALADGQWVVKLDRRPGVADATAQKSRQRLRAYGPLSTVLRVNGSSVAQVAPPPSVPRTAVVRAVAAPPPPPESAAAKAAREDIEGRKAALELLRLEIEERKLKRELASHSVERPSPPQAPIWPSILAVLAPIVERFISSAQSRDAMLLRMLTERSEAPEPMALPALPVTSPTSTIRETIETMRELLGAAAELNLGGAGGEASLPAAIASLVQTLAPLLTAPAPSPARNRIDSQQHRQPKGDPVKLRVAQWVISVHQAAQADLVPSAVADELDHAFNLLPGKMRALVLEAPSLEALLSGLVEWVPEHFIRQLQAAVATNAQVRTWLETFVAAVREEDEPDDDEHAGNGLAPHQFAATLAGGDSPAGDE